MGLGSSRTMAGKSPIMELRSASEPTLEESPDRVPPDVPIPCLNFKLSQAN